MTTATETIRTAILTGDTYSIRSLLKLDDWTYDAASKSWSRPFATLTIDQIWARLSTIDRNAMRRCGRLTCRIVTV